MPASKRRLRIADSRSRRVFLHSRERGKSITRCELDSSLPLIAPSHSFRLPSLANIKSKYQVSYGSENALSLGEALISKGLLTHRHFDKCQDVAEVVQKALSEAITTASPAGDDRFDVEIRISDKLDEGESRRDCLFFKLGKQ